MVCLSLVKIIQDQDPGSDNFDLCLFSSSIGKDYLFLYVSHCRTGFVWNSVTTLCWMIRIPTLFLLHLMWEHEPHVTASTRKAHVAPSYTRSLEMFKVTPYSTTRLLPFHGALQTSTSAQCSGVRINCVWLCGKQPLKHH